MEKPPKSGGKTLIWSKWFIGLSWSQKRELMEMDSKLSENHEHSVSAIGCLHEAGILLFDAGKGG